MGLGTKTTTVNSDVRVISVFKVESRAALPVHHTETSGSSWDGPANEAQLSSDASASILRKAFAWIDPDKDAETKAAYRFIHHEVSGDGDPGAANLIACSTGIGVLNGGRGGTTIPDTDRAGVYAHLAAHLKDAGKEPPELKTAELPVERRAWSLAEVRAVEPETDAPQITGYAAVFNSPSEEIEEWGFRFTELIRPGAFNKTLKEADIRALVNHDPNYVLGRNTAGTLALTEDKRGLAVNITPPDTQWARDLQSSMRRGDVNQMSFAFRVVKERFTEDNTDTKRVLRELLEVQLFDVSVVTYPAYPATSAAVRNLWRETGLDLEPIISTLLRKRAGLSLSCADSACVEETWGHLREYLRPEPASGHSIAAAARRRQLELLTIG